jgi:hypothetical protein
MDETTAEREAREHFEKVTADHVMVIKHDDGVYRHITFGKASNDGFVSSMYRIDLITFPGHLVIAGDMDSYTFKRTHDMFDFFDGPGGINPMYWGEKIIASRSGATQHFSPDKAKRAIVEQFMEDRHQWDNHTAALFRQLREEVLDVLTEVPEGTESPDVAKKAMNEFAFYKPPAPGEKAIPRWQRGNYPDYTLADWYDFDMEEYDHHFLWVCHAIRWGISKYREETANSERASEPAGSSDVPPADGGRDPGSSDTDRVGGRGRHAADGQVRSLVGRIFGKGRAR